MNPARQAKWTYMWQIPSASCRKVFSPRPNNDSKTAGALKASLSFEVP